MNEKTHIIANKRTTHDEARRLAQLLRKPVMYWPYFPHPKAHTVYPPKRR